MTGIRTDSREARPGTSRIRSFSLVGRLGWGVADQGISSLSNFVLGILAAQQLSAENFGAFSLAFVTFSFVLSASRGPSTDPLLVRFSGSRGPRWRDAVAAASGTAVTIGAVAGVACILIGMLLPGAVGSAFIALGVGLPGILLQDSYRFAFFSCGEGQRAFVNDLFWGVIQAAGLTALLLSDSLTVVSCMLVFGGTATVAAGLGYLQTRIAPDLRRVRDWLVGHRDLGLRYFIENVSIGGARQSRMYVVGAIAGLAAVGQIRAAEILMGPFLVLLSGVSQVSVPEARHVLDRTPRRLLRFCGLLAGAQATLALAWGAAVFVILPMGVGEQLLHGLWEPASLLLLPILVTLVLGCFENGAAAGTRALGASRRSVFAQTCNAGLYLVGGTAGAIHSGALGSCWGVVIATSIGCVIWWTQLRRALAEHLAAGPAGPPAAGDLADA